MTRLIFLLTIFILSAESANGIDKQKDEIIQTSSKQYPTVYASMGSPLFESLNVFEKYSHLGEMNAVNRKYENFMKPIFQFGMELSGKKKLQGSERSAYLRKLRALQEEKKRVMFHLSNLTMKAVDEDDYETFESLVSLPLDELLPTMSRQVKAINYYKAKRKGRIPAMDALALKVQKHRKARKHQESYDVADTAPRNYRLKSHLPTSKTEAEQITNAEDEKVKSGPQSDEKNASALKQIGNVFKWMGVDFDPSLLEEYKSHKPPSVDDINN